MFRCAPGCCKTTLVRAAATASGAHVVALAGAALFSMYVGEGEALLRSAFQRARQAAPSIIFLDELDALVGARRLRSHPRHDLTLDFRVSTPQTPPLSSSGIRLCADETQLVPTHSHDDGCSQQRFHDRVPWNSRNFTLCKRLTADCEYILRSAQGKHHWLNSLTAPNPHLMLESWCWMLSGHPRVLSSCCSAKCR